jgi:putative FmdB family regulatory protein
MPTYDYECPGEGIVRELSLPINHEPPKCETCGTTMVRVYNYAPPIHFKGSGFYKTGG